MSTAAACSRVVPHATAPALPETHSPAFLRTHARDTLSFWARHELMAPEGGLFHCLDDGGRVYDARTRHLVSSTRLVVQFAWAITQNIPLLPGAPTWRELLDSCLGFLRTYHYVPKTGGYRWSITVGGPSTTGTETISHDDNTNRSYGLAFVLLAYSAALDAGVEGTRALVDEVTATLTAHFWEESNGLYADEANADFSTLDTYRGQNANMHAVEAHMAAFRATGDILHAQRARTIARNMCVRQAALVECVTGAGALVYEHYGPDWSPDLNYNIDKPSDVYRPWGFQPGHLLEWSKLLLQLDLMATASAPRAPPEAAEDSAWRLPTARRFFDAALRGWDSAGGGGFIYTCKPEPGLPFGDDHKYKWPQAEGIAAVALLAAASIDKKERSEYLEWYDRIWAFSWAHLADHINGSYFRLLTRALEKVEVTKCPPGKVDYHITGMCYDVAAAFERML